MLIERHKIDQVCCFIPIENYSPESKYYEYHKDGKPKFCTEVIRNGKLIAYETTRLDELRNAAAKGQKWYGRMDIAIKTVDDICKCHCGHEHTKSKQYLLYPKKNGKIGGDLSKFTQNEIAEAEAESRKCWEVALNCPEFMVLYEYHFDLMRD